MTVLASETFESGTIGAAVTEAQTIFADVSSTGITYVTGLAGSTKACNVNPTSVTAACRNSGFAAMGKIVVRFVFKFSAAPAANTVISHICLGDPNAGGTRIGNLYLTTNRQLSVRNVWTEVALSAMQFSVDTEYAVEWMFDGANQQQSLRIFTSVVETATAAETLGPVAANVGPTTADWVSIGKLTNVVWTGGITLDNYKRADNWIAAPANVILWNQEWVGTDGNDITLPVGWVTEGTNTALPKYKVGGPNVDQSYVNFNGQTVGNRNLVSTQLPAGQHTYERFYLQLNGKPTLPEEEETVWSAGSAAERVFRLVAVSGVGDNYDLELWSDGNWDPTAIDPPVGEPPLPVPLGILTGFAIDTFHRIEIDITATTGPATCTVKAWKGTRRNSEAAPDQTVSGDCVATISLRYRRYEQRLHASVANTVAHKGVAFDGIVVSQDGSPIGPLPLNQQYDPPLVSQWSFYEWDGVNEIPLSLAGASTGGASIEQVNIGDTTSPPVEPPPGGLFTADPGLGSKLYASADAYPSSDRYNMIADLYNFEMRTLSAGAGHPASNRCAPGCYRGFYGSPRPSISWGRHADSTWTLHRKVAANTAMSSWTFDNNDTAGAIATYDGTANSWLTNTLAPMVKEAYERYGHLTIIDLANEPDAWSNAPNQARVPKWFTETRRAARYVYFYLRDELNVPEEAYMVSCATTTQATSYEHEKRHAQAIRLTENAWLSEAQRGDAIYYLCPDWKGTRTLTNGYWSDAYDPNPVDFIQAGEMDPWSYGRGPISRIITHNFYERDYEYNNIETLAEFRSKVVSIPGGWPRGGNLFKFNKALYGGVSPVLPVPSANRNGVPVFIGELGLGVWVPLPSSTNAAVPKDTADAYCESFIKDMVEVCNIVGYAKWRYVDQPNNVGYDGSDPYHGTDNDEIDTYTHHWKVGSGSPSGTHIYDSTNANTKAEAAIFNTQYVADPPPWPDGTVRPPYVSINGGAKRDYRGIGDVP